MTELERAYECINQLEDLLGDVLTYLEGDDPQYFNAKPALIEWIQAYFAARMNRRAS